MTTLVMVQTKDDVLLGWDSLITTGNQVEVLTTPKYFRNGPAIFGVSGSLRALDLLETVKLPAGKVKAGNERRWLIENFVPAFRDEIASDPALFAEDGTLSSFGIHVVINGVAMDFDNMMAVSGNADGIYTLGSGGDYARGVLYDHRNDHVLSETDVFAALEAAECIDPYTGGHLSVARASEMMKA